MKLNMMMNGIFHGLSLDGVPTLMPVLGVLQCVTVCCNMLQCAAEGSLWTVLGVLQYVVVCCSVLQSAHFDARSRCVAVCCSVLQSAHFDARSRCVTVCYSVFQCGSVLQCAAKCPL